MQERKFYPMLTQTIKSALRLADSSNIYIYVDLLVTYPQKSTYNAAIREYVYSPSDPIADIIIKELDRQYTRWNKGGING
jgi:hypothetical protein